MTSNRMIDQFKTFEDLSAFARAQQKTLTDLLKKNKTQEDEIKHLKKLVEGAVPVIVGPKAAVDFSAKDEESIAREQLFMLKQKSTNEELTMEDAKKVEIYSKILNSLKEKNTRDVSGTSKNLSEAELLSLVQPISKDTNGR